MTIQGIATSIENHAVLVDLLIKSLAVIGTIGGAIFAIYRYFADRRQSRRSVELDLKRRAYAQYFAALPRQLSLLGSLYSFDAEPSFDLPLPGHPEMFSLHLLAGNDALKCVISRNALFGKGFLRLLRLAREIRQFRAVAEGGLVESHEAALKRVDRFKNEFKETVTSLNDNYRDLLLLARADVEMSTDADAIQRALIEDQKEGEESLREILAKRDRAS